MLIDFPECYAVRHQQLTNLSDAYLRETQRLEIAILDLLHTYVRVSLTPDQQLSYDIYEWYLDNLVRGHVFIYENFPINGYGSWDLANRFVAGMLNLPIKNKQDAEDYVTRLAQTGTWVEQLLEGLRLREQAGIIPPVFLLEDALVQLEGHMQMQSPGVYDVEATELYTNFNAKLQDTGDIRAPEKQALLDAASAEISQTFIPAFTELREYLIHLKSVASNEGGLDRLPNGDAYYAYLLRRYTGTTLSADEIHEMGLAQVAHLQAEMRQVAVDLGHPADISMAEIDQILDEENNLLEGDALLAEYERLLAEAKIAAGDFFGSFPSTDVVITYDQSAPVPGYYTTPPLDGSGPGQMIVNLQNPSMTTLYNEFSLMHHETIPGHHMQLAMNLDLPAFRPILCSDVYLKDIEFQGFTEGWAVYAQQLGWEMGLYEDDAMSNLSRLRLMLNQVARMVVDTGIHAKGWSRAEAAAYFTEATGRPSSVRQMNRYVALPGQAVSYNFGMLTILRLRQQAMDQLGQQFDIKEFHDIVLRNGALPLNILEQVVNDWLSAKRDR